MLCGAVPAHCPCESVGIPGILEAGPGRVALCLLVAPARVTSAKACAPRPDGHFTPASCSPPAVAWGSRPRAHSHRGGSSDGPRGCCSHRAPGIPSPWADATPHIRRGGATMSNPLLVGIDVHRTTNTVCLMDRQGREVAPRFRVDNNRPGTDAFVGQVSQRVVTGDFDAIQIAAEATGWYWWHFFQTLDQDPAWRPWPGQLYPLNPRLTANFKKTSVDLDH